MIYGLIIGVIKMTSTDPEKEKIIRDRLKGIEDEYGYAYSRRAILYWADNYIFGLNLEELQRIIYGDAFMNVQEQIKARKIKAMTKNTLSELEDLNT